jgi:hypothetical protein
MDVSVIKHQKGGDWKSIFLINDSLVFVVNTQVINLVLLVLKVFG